MQVGNKEIDVMKLLEAAGTRTRKPSGRRSKTNTLRRSAFSSYQGYVGPIRVTAPWKSQVSDYRRLKIANDTLSVRDGQVEISPIRTKKEWHNRHGALR